MEQEKRSLERQISSKSGFYRNKSTERQEKQRDFPSDSGIIYQLEQENRELRLKVRQLETEVI